MATTRLLFVCLGNICRSPTAEGVMRRLLAEAGLDGEVVVDSAGTAGYHIGRRPDRRSHDEAVRRGLDLSDLRARQVAAADLTAFDLMLAMDGANLAALRALATDEPSRSRLRLLREFDPAAVASGDLDVPDPYHGGPDGFALVFDMVEAACRGLVEELRPGLIGSTPG